MDEGHIMTIINEGWNEKCAMKFIVCFSVSAIAVRKNCDFVVLQHLLLISTITFILVLEWSYISST